MRRLKNITLEEAYKQTGNNIFAIWVVKGNCLDYDIPENLHEVETYVFLGEAIFLLWISAKNEKEENVRSIYDFLDIWPNVKTKYSKLFENDIEGDLLILA